MKKKSNEIIAKEKISGSDNSIVDSNQQQNLSVNDRDIFGLRTEAVQFTQFDSSRTIWSKVRKLLKSAINREEDLLMRGSGWRFESLMLCDIQVTNI